MVNGLSEGLQDGQRLRESLCRAAGHNGERALFALLDAAADGRVQHVDALALSLPGDPLDDRGRYRAEIDIDRTGAWRLERILGADLCTRRGSCSARRARHQRRQQPPPRFRPPVRSFGLRAPARVSSRRSVTVPGRSPPAGCSAQRACPCRQDRRNPLSCSPPRPRETIAPAFLARRPSRREALPQPLPPSGRGARRNAPNMSPASRTLV